MLDIKIQVNKYLLKQLKGSYAEVGVINNELSALKGAVHEFGSIGKNIPARSFLRVPLSKYKPSKIDADDLEGTMNRMGAEAMAIVVEQFETGGGGKWQKLKPKTIKRKKSDKILVDTGELAKSITYRIHVENANNTEPAIDN